MALETQVCSRCRFEWRKGMVRECPHPRVREVYGGHICVYCCKKCKFRVPVKYFDGLKCGYQQGEWSYV